MRTMSKNCIRCVVNKRDGIDLLCHSCREKNKKEAGRQQVSQLMDRLDLMADEFMRIRLLTDNKEIIGICSRALEDVRRHVPLIAECENQTKRANTAEKEVIWLHGQCLQMHEALLACKKYFTSDIPKTEADFKASAGLFNDAYEALTKALDSTGNDNWIPYSTIKEALDYAEENGLV